MTRQTNHLVGSRTRAALAAATCGFIGLLGPRVFGEVPGNQVYPGGPDGYPPPQYELVDLGTLGGPSSRAIAMSDRGAIVGSSEIGLAQASMQAPPIHAFLWFGGVMQDLGTLGGDWSEARGVNSARQVVGSSLDADGRQRAFYFYEAMSDLNDLIAIAQDAGDPSFVPAPQLLCANAINNAGQIVACGTVSTDDLVHAYLLSPIEPYTLDAPSFSMQDLGAIRAIEISAPGNRPNADDPGLADPLDGLLGAWGGKDSAWDLDGDGTVGMTDLLILLGEMAEFTVEAVAAGNSGNELFTGGVDVRSLRQDQPGLGSTDGAHVAGLPGTDGFSFGGRLDRSRQQQGDVGGPAVPVAAGNGNSVYTGGDPLPGIPGAPGLLPHDCTARDINDLAVIVGSQDEQAFVWMQGVSAPVEVSAAESAANAVNETGQIAGWTMTPIGPAASIWFNGDRFDLFTRRGFISEALDVNDAGHVVGWASPNKDGADARAYLWAGGAAFDLTRVTIVQLTIDFARIEEAVAIDELGRIAGSYRTADGRTVASLLVPVD